MSKTGLSYQILLYLQNIFFRGILISMVLPVIIIREKEIKFYQAPIDFQFFVLCDFLIECKKKIADTLYLTDLFLFYPFFLYLIIIILLTLFLDPQTPKKYSFIAFFVILGLSIFAFFLKDMVTDVEILLIIIKLIYGTGCLRCAVLAILHKNHLMLPLVTLIQVFFYNIFSLVLYQKNDVVFSSVIDFYYVGIVLNVIQIIIYIILKMSFTKKPLKLKDNKEQIRISLVINNDNE